MICRFCGKTINRSPRDDAHIKHVSTFGEYEFPNPCVPAWRSNEIEGSLLACNKPSFSTTSLLAILRWHEPLVPVVEMLTDLREIEKDLR